MILLDVLRKWRAILLVSVWVLSPCVFAEQMRFDRLFTDGGYQDLGPVSDIVQDSHGFIWIAGESGLGRYDGSGLKHYPLDNSTLWDMHLDHEGILWLATDKGLARYSQTDDAFSHYTVESTKPNGLSHDLIYKIKEDANRQLYLVTQNGLNIFNIHDETFRYYPLQQGQDDQNGESGLNTVFDVHIDQEGLAWLATGQLGVGIFDPQTETIRFLRHSNQDPNSLVYDSVRALLEDSRQGLWIGTYGGGLSYYNKSTGTFTNYVHDADDPHSISSNTFWHIFEDSHQQVWFASDAGGLLRYRQETDDFVSFQHDPTDTSSIISNVARVVFEDARGDLWVGAFPSGVSYFNRATAAFQNFTSIPDDPNTLTHNAILSFEEDDHGRVWIGTEGGFNLYDKKTQTFERFSNTNPKYRNLRSNAILSIQEDQDGFLWIGTWSGGLHRFNPNDNTIQNYFDIEQYPKNPNSVFIWDIEEDPEGNLWFATETGGVNFYHYAEKTFKSYTRSDKDSESISGNFVRALLVDNNGILWSGSVIGLDSFDSNTQSFRHHYLRSLAAEDPDKIKDETLRSRALLQDKKGRIWLGTNDDGVYIYEPKRNTAKHLSSHNGLLSSYVATIVEDQQGIVWLGTTDGMVRVDPETWQTRIFHKGHGLAGNSINRNASFIDSDGLVYMGTTDGLSIFNPENIQTKPYDFPVKITDFKIFNKEVKIDQKNGILRENVVNNPPITLTHNLNMFSFEFSAMSYRSPERNTYRYILEGFDNNWLDVGTRNVAIYTSLPAGTYTFKVMAADGDGQWSGQSVTQKIIILPPPWKTWWAYLLYVLTIVTVVTVYVRAQQAKIERERKVNERLRQLDKMKDDFLANTSHELRTPLNGIIGIADSLVDGAAGEVSEFLKSNLKMISVSGRRLSNLVNDILDFSKSRNNSLTIYPKSLNLYEAAEMVVTFCEPSFGVDNITIVNEVSPELPPVHVDENRIQQILYNLIGNAVKFTEEGSITIAAKQDKGFVFVSVKDTGIGIPKDKFESIFESFSQVEDHESRQASGTGLGLTVTKQLVELHGGSITVESEVNKGSTFTFSVPISTEAAEKSAFALSVEAVPVSKTLGAGHDSTQAVSLGDVAQVEESEADARSAEKLRRIREEIHPDDFKKNADFRILIVDDEPVNRQVLLNQLRMQNYQTAEAASGQEALDLIENDGWFDIILLDIMMPKMSGYDVCTILREKYSVHELPIIFLTAKNLISDLVDGFEVGANDFLTKPISSSELTSRVRTHLQLLDINRTLDERVKIRTSELEALDGIVATINQEVKLDRLLEVILQEALILFPMADHAAYWRPDYDHGYFELMSAQNVVLDEEAKICVPQEDIEQVYMLAENEIEQDIYFISKVDCDIGRPDREHIPCFCSAVVIAMRLDSELIGLLVLGNQNDGDAFQQKQTPTFNRFRTHVISALSKARLLDRLADQCNYLEEVSLTDQLTNLRNRRYLFKYLDPDVAVVKRKRHANQQKALSGLNPGSGEDSLIFFLVDIDRFKQTNDEYGHTAGDRVLVQMKEVFEKVFREMDYLIRWGGEEFLIVARFCDRAGAGIMAERLRSTMEKFEFEIDNGRVINSTCSIGFACYPFLDDDIEALSWTQVVDVADHCLYAAKKSQRNAWVGILGEGTGDRDQLFKHIVEYPEQMIMNKEIRIETSIEDHKSLIWK